jgi:hypothetical protein
MTDNTYLKQMIPLLLLCGALSTTAMGADSTALPQTTDPELRRTIDASQYFRPFPSMPAGRNTSIQKTPPPALAGLSEKEYGRPKITKCWLNLDEIWDYRTRKYNYNCLIGVHKYDGIKEKHGETWGGVKETNIPFHDYLQAFGTHSDEVMLTIRRYERDILDGKLGVTMDDWREMFRNAVIHYREICPNLRYIEVCNEYTLKGFIGCNADEYYSFYKTAYQAVNEANEELRLTGPQRVLMGGPAVTGDIVKKIDLFLENFSKDDSEGKCLDFVSWHEYSKPYQATALREGVVQALLAKHGLHSQLPMFVTEHDPYHPKAGSREYNLINGAGLVKSLYFSNVYSPNMTLMPWVQYHIGDIQTRFMWFDGPNKVDTKAEELRMLPAGCSMKLLSMHKKREIAVDNSLANNEIVLASVEKQGIAVHAVNYGESRKVDIRVNNLSEVFTAAGTERVKFIKYLIDENHSNAVTDPNYPGGIEKIDEGYLTPNKGELRLAHPELAKNGILMWVISPAKIGVPLNRPITKLPQFAKEASQPAAFNVTQALDCAVAEKDASIERDGTTYRVQVSKSMERPGITFRPPSGEWSMAGFKALQATVKNTSKHNLSIHLVIDGPMADRTHRKNCIISSVSIAAGASKTISTLLGAVPPRAVQWLMTGKSKALPATDAEGKSGFNGSRVTAISIYVYHPGSDFTYEVSDLQGIKE